MKLCRKLPRNLQIYPQYASTLDMPSVNNWWIPDEFVTSSTGTDQPWRHHRLKSRYTRRLAPGCGCRGSGVAATWVKHDPISITTTRKRHGLAGLAYLSPIRVIRVPGNLGNLVFISASAFKSHSWFKGFPGTLLSSLGLLVPWHNLICNYHNIHVSSSKGMGQRRPRHHGTKIRWSPKGFH